MVLKAMVRELVAVVEHNLQVVRLVVPMKVVVLKVQVHLALVATLGDSAGGGAGGGGYYGGGGGGYNDGGGGGSSYIGGVSNAQSIAGNSTMPNPDGGTMTGRDDNGLVVISW